MYYSEDTGSLWRLQQCVSEWVKKKAEKNKEEGEEDDARQFSRNGTSGKAPSGASEAEHLRRKDDKGRQKQ